MFMDCTLSYGVEVRLKQPDTSAIEDFNSITDISSYLRRNFVGSSRLKQMLHMRTRKSNIRKSFPKRVLLGYGDKLPSFLGSFPRINHNRSSACGFGREWH
jgi:hypothetical protein